MARAGNFRDRITVMRESGTGGLDAYGNPAGLAWAAVATLWGDLRETTGKENLEAGRLEGTGLATLRLRSSATARAITSADRVTARGHTWAITGAPIQVSRAGDILEITLKRGGAVN